MLIKIDLNSEIPIYQQLKNSIIIGIAKNDLKKNEDLPSVRQLASDLSVNLHTIRKVYNQLKNEGYVNINHKKGTVVAKMPIESTDSKKEELNNNLELIIASCKCNGQTDDEIKEFVDSILLKMKGV